MELWSVVRWLRAAGFSAVCAGLASAGHVAGGGSVAPAPLAAGFLALLVPALAFTGRERTIGGIMPALGASQVFWHLLLSQAAPDQAESVPTAAALAAHHAGPPGSGMLLMHAVAVLVTAWWLECGEAGLCALVRCLAAWAVAPLLLLFAVVASAPPRPAPVWPEAARLRPRALRHILETRGPPVGTAAFG